LRIAALNILPLSQVAVWLLIEPQRVVGVVDAERALTTGMMTDNSPPSDMRGRSWFRRRMDILQEANLRALLVNYAGAAGIKPVQPKPRRSASQIPEALLQLPFVEGGVDAKSSKNEKVTGPAMGMRYSHCVSWYRRQWRLCHRPESESSRISPIPAGLATAERNCRPERCTGYRREWNIAVGRSAADVKSAQVALPPV